MHPGQCASRNALRATPADATARVAPFAPGPQMASRSLALTAVCSELFAHSSLGLTRREYSSTTSSRRLLNCPRGIASRMRSIVRWKKRRL